jgi:formylmethanofuran dehydrogenase subunit A
MASTILRGGHVVDPLHGPSVQRDIAVRDGRIVAAAPSETFDLDLDARGCTVMAGGIDLHTHIGGGKVNLARALMPEDHRDGSGNPIAPPARWPPATAMSRWATPRRSSRRWWPATRAMPTWRWATCRCSTTAPT